MPNGNSIAKGNDWEGIWAETLGEGPHMASRYMLCENQVFELDLRTDRAMNGQANWLGDASGPEHTANPGGSGDATGDSSNGAAGAVDLGFWIETIRVSSAIDPVTVGQSTGIRFRFSESSGTSFLGQGPGDPNGLPPFSLTTDNGS